MDVVAALRSSAFFGSLTDGDIEVLLVDAETVAYTAGVSIHEAGDQDGRLLVLLSGAATVTPRPLTHAREPVLGPGAVFGEIAFMDGQPRHDTAVALTDCVVLAVPRTALARLVAHRPAVLPPILDALAAVLRAWGDITEVPVPRHRGHA